MSRLDSRHQLVEPAHRLAPAVGVLTVELHVAEELGEDGLVQLPDPARGELAQEGDRLLEKPQDFQRPGGGPPRVGGRGLGQPEKSRLLAARLAIDLLVLSLEAPEQAIRPDLRRLPDVLDVRLQEVGPVEVDEAEILAALAPLAEEGCPELSPGRRVLRRGVLRNSPELQPGSGRVGSCLAGLAAGHAEREDVVRLSFAQAPPRFCATAHHADHGFVLSLLADAVDHDDIPDGLGFHGS